jgi:osmotically-inducible protein OsmY
MKKAKLLCVSFCFLMSWGCASRQHEAHYLSDQENGPAAVLSEKNGKNQTSPADVKVGEEIRQAILEDKKLAPPPSNVIASVQDGVVTLRGSVPSRDDKEVMKERIEQLPGVARVDVGELKIKGYRNLDW